MARENTSITIDPELKAKAKAFRLNLSDICSKAIQAEVNKLESPDMVLLKAKENQEKASIAVATPNPKGDKP